MVGDARTVDADSARDLLLAYLILGGDVDWRSSLFVSGCMARLGASNGQGTLTHFRTFYLTDDDFYLVSETGFLSPPHPPPPNDLLGTLVSCLIVKSGMVISICSLCLFLSVISP